MIEEAKAYLKLELNELVEEFTLLLYKLRDNSLLDKVNHVDNIEDIEEFCELLEYIGEQASFILQIIKRHKEMEDDYSETI